VIFSTHVMSQAEKLCQSLLMLARGKLLFSGTLGEALAVAPPGPAGRSSLHDMFLYLSHAEKAA
jgi:ABC-type multidrug transport system ATPase subunit